jgi:hypothetical protein
LSRKGKRTVAETTSTATTTTTRRRSEEETHLVEDLADLGLETHVEHAVSLVHNEVGDATEVELAGLEHVDETTGGGDDDLGTALEVADLSSLGDTTVDASVADAGRGTELGALLLNLNGELTSRGEDEDDGTVTGGEEWLSVDVDHGREGEGDGLSGTGGGDGDDVASGEGHGPRLALNGGGGGEPGTLDLVHDVRGEVHLIEVGDRLDNISAEDLDLLLATEFLHLALRTSRDAGVLLVEVLFERHKGGRVPVLGTETGTKVGH